MNITVKRIARQLCNARNNLPVIMVEGDKAPVIVGSDAHWTTPKGEYVRHPNAYRKNFGRPIYHKSTVRVEVGAEFMADILALALKTR